MQSQYFMRGRVVAQVRSIIDSIRIKCLPFLAHCPTSTTLISEILLFATHKQSGALFLISEGLVLIDGLLLDVYIL